MGRFLIVESESIPSVDRIVVLAGDSGARVEKAVEVYKRYNVPLIMTGSPFYGRSYPYYMKEYAISLGVPSDAIELEEASYSTADHALHLSPYFQRYGDDAVLIVTSKFHTRRSLYAFTTLSKKENIIFYTVGADDTINYDEWWMHYEMLETVLLEWARLIFYWIYW